jgi:hypothetical protein
MSWTRRDVLALGSLALAGAALGPSRVAAQTPKRGGTLSIRGWDPPLFDPMLTTAYRVHVPLSLTHSRLVRHRAGPSVPPGTFPIEGDLAESWTQPNETTSATTMAAAWWPPGSIGRTRQEGQGPERLRLLRRLASHHPDGGPGAREHGGEHHDHQRHADEGGGERPRQ